MNAWTSVLVAFMDSERTTGLLPTASLSTSTRVLCCFDNGRRERPDETWYAAELEANVGHGANDVLKVGAQADDIKRNKKSELLLDHYWNVNLILLQLLR